MARATRVNSITSPEKTALINKQNMALKKEFLRYLKSAQRSPQTIAVYDNDLLIVFTYLLENADNKSFIDLKKRDLVGLQDWLISENGNSPARVRRIKATMSSLSNFICNIYDDEFPNFRNIIGKIESPVNQPVRKKTVLSEEQVNGLLEGLVAKKKYRQAVAVALAACSGRRKSELTRFKVSYFTDDNIIYGSLYKTPEEVKTKGRGNGKFIHCYTLAKQFKPYLDLWMQHRAELGVESEWLLYNESDPSKPISIESLDSWTGTFTKMLGVDFYWHSLRHYVTTYLSKAGIPDSVIAGLISWESVDMVKIYKDTTIDDDLGKYFGSDGIKSIESTDLSDL